MTSGIRHDYPLSLADLLSVLKLRPKEHIAITGGGGKTSLMFALAKGLCDSGYRVVTSTTTKVLYEEARKAPEVVFVSSGGEASLEEIKEGLDSYGHVFAARNPRSSKKVAGMSRAEADRLFAAPWLDHLVLETDGAAGHPLKAHARHEPVMPSTATLVFAVMGLEALCQRFGPELVFRPTLFKELIGLEYGDVLEPESLARLFQLPGGLFKASPESSRRIAFLNKADLLEDATPASELAEAILDDPSGRVQTVITGSVNKGIFQALRRD